MPLLDCPSPTSNPSAPSAQRQRIGVLWALALGSLMTACGGGGGSSNTASSPSPSPSASPSPSPAAGGGAVTPSNTSPWNYAPATPSRSGCGSSEGTVYEVGDGQLALTAVPWSSLVACDQVLINYRSTPYKSIIYFSARGAANKFITIRGVPGPNGERPILDGDGAVEPTLSLNPNGGYARSGLIVLGFRPGNNTKPGYLHITGLTFRNARPGYNIVTSSGGSAAWPAFSPGIFAAPADQMAITRCEFANNGLGLFVNSGGGETTQSRGLLIANNYFHDNGVSGNFSVHHAYTEAIGTIYEYNYFGPLVSGSGGDGVKDRSAGIILRYNHFAGGQYMISLRDPESNESYESAAADIQGDLLVNHAFIYGNRFLFGANSGVVVGHGDGSYGNRPDNRFGNLFFYNNQVVSSHNWDGLNNHAATLFQLLNTLQPTTVHAYNNLFYAGPATTGGLASPLALFTFQGPADFKSNWINSFINRSLDSANGSVAVGTAFDGSGLNGLAAQATSPGFTNAAGGDYTLLNSSPFFSLNATLPTEVTVRGLAPLANTQPVASPFAGPTYGN